MLLPLLLALAIPAQGPVAAVPRPIVPDTGLIARTRPDSVTPRPATAPADAAIQPNANMLPPWLRVAAQLRTRAEAVSHFQLTAGAAQRDVFGLSRLMAGATISTTYVGAELSARHVVLHSQDLPGGRRASDEDRFDIDAATVTLRCCAPTPGDAAAPAAAVRIGRQPLRLGRERLLGVADWGNARRTFDAVHLSGTVSGRSAEAFHARPVVIREHDFNRADTSITFSGAAIGAANQRWQLYTLDFRQQRTTGEHHRLTMGGRLFQTAKPGQIGYELESAWQTGELDGRRVAAWFVASEVITALGGTWSPEVGVGVDAGSGDRDPADDRVGGFHVPFPTGHSHGGLADIVGRPNTVELRILGTLTPLPRLQLRGVAYRFSRLSLRDGAHSKGSTALRAAAPGSRSIGTEADLTATYRTTGGVRVLAGIAQFVPGRFLLDSPTGARSARWGFIGTTLDF